VGGRQYLDTREIYDKRLEVDWANAVAKRRFRDVVAKADDDSFAGIKTELQVRETVPPGLGLGLGLG